MGPADYHSSTGLDAGNACFRNGSQDHGHHTNSQPPELATFACAYALADACTSTVPISRRTFSDLLSARRGGGGGYYTKVMNQVYRLPVLESRHSNGETRSAKLRNPHGMMHSAMRQRTKRNKLAEERLWKHNC